MNKEQQQEALNLIAECNQRLSNHCVGGLSTLTARRLVGKLIKFMSKVEDETGMTNIPEYTEPEPEPVTDHFDAMWDARLER